MSADDAKVEIIEPMQRMFDARRGLSDGDRKKLLNEYVDVLKVYDADILRAAWQVVRVEHARGSWPLPVVIVTAAKAAIKLLRYQPAAGPVDERVEAERWLQRFCELRGLDADLMRRPNLWWLQPKAQWREHWREDQIPKPSVRLGDGVRRSPDEFRELARLLEAQKLPVPPKPTVQEAPSLSAERRAALAGLRDRAAERAGEYSPR